MASEHPLISVVVLNWNGKKFIDPFMESFKKLDYPEDKLELIFADNDSVDDSVSYIQKKYSALQQLKVVQNGDNYGYAGGNNRGMLHAQGEYVLVCNNDLRLDPNLVKELVKVAQSKESAVTVPKLMFLNKPGYINNAGSELRPNQTWPIQEIGINQKDSAEYSKVREITAFCGACALFSREFLQDVGMFDSKFFMYFEDGDLSWRGQRAGYKYYLAPKALAYHEHTGTSKEGSPLFNYYVGRNRQLILIKNAPLKVILRGFYESLNNQIFQKTKRLIRSILKNRQNVRYNLVELLRGLKILFSTTILTPYLLLKRWGILKEEKL